MWIYISAIAKTIIFSTQTEVEIFHKLFFCKTIHNYCRKHQKFAKFVILHNRIQISEKFSPIISKIGIFSSATAIVQHTKRKLLTHKLSRAAINCSYIYCEGIYNKVLQTHIILFKCTFVVTGVRKSNNISTQKYKENKSAYINNYNKNKSKWLILLAQKAACPLIYSTCHHCQI